MATAAARARRDGGRARSALRARLEARREEIEAAALTRVRAIADPAEVSDPAYAENLRAAVAAAVEYGIEVTGHSPEGAPPIPVALLAQARLAARVGISLDTVLRRYFAGYSLLGFYLMEEASREGLMDGVDLQRLIVAHAGTFDRLLAAVGEEHGREAETLQRSTKRRQVEQIERLLAGEPLEAAELAYGLDGWHLGIVASGRGAERTIRRLASQADCRLLLCPRDGEVAWGWIGTRHRLDPGEPSAFLSSRPPAKCVCALGEPGEGPAGWRHTHRQAAAALPVARRTSGKVVRYADVALTAAALADDLLTTSLHQLYIAPLEGERDGGRTLKETLRAYLAANGNLASAAASAGVTSRTVRNRLRRIEVLIGRSLYPVMADIEVALQLYELDSAELASSIRPLAST